ncbi:hypothetical protein [Brumimicrobium mesophilum]|uniref:hypothetical protein n=1 Tax=Brumimicrobium mesophilum TaxID=392717 RepID=UPI00131BBD56|nr:hypothetical protein [Brumimicrobium mesophilum]
MKPFSTVLFFLFLLMSCSIQKDISEMKSNVLRLPIHQADLNSHFKNGNYILSIHDSIGISLKERFKNVPDSEFFKKDTIELSLLNQFFAAHQIKRELRICFESKKINVYSLSNSEYLYKIKRTVSKTKFNDIHSFYFYSNPDDNEEILNSHSFNTGTPSF